MRLRTIGVAVTIIVFATACEKAFEDASGGIGDAPAIPAPGDPATSPTTVPASPPPSTDTGSGPSTPPTMPPPTTTSSPPTTTVTQVPSDPEVAPSATIMFDEEGRDGDAGPLGGASVDRPFGARLSIEDPSVQPVRVTWLIDGQVFRDDDLDAPYTIRYNGRELPLDVVFRSDQGLTGRWSLDRGTIHEISAVVEVAGDDLTASAVFEVATSDTEDGAIGGEAAPPPPTTTAAPPPASVSPTEPGAGGWPTPGPVPGRTTVSGSGNWVVDYRDHGTPWHIHDVDVVVSGGHAVGPPTVSGGGIMENASVVVEGGDNVKIADDGIYRNLYLRMATSGGHLDAMQSQGNTGWRIENVVVEIPSPTDSVTGAIIIENMVGGGGGYRDVVGTIDRLKIIGTGPWHHDIRLQNDPAATMTVTITNVDWSQAHPDSVLVLTGSPGTLTVYVDDSVPDGRIRGADNATVVRI